MSMWDKNTNKSIEHLNYLKKVKKRKLTVLSMQLSVLILFFVLWEFLADIKIIDSFISSQPSRIIRTLVSLYSQGELIKHIAITCTETIVGFLSGTILGTIIAVILWWSKFISDVLEPYLVILNSLPKIALGPIFIVWLGPGPLSIIVMALAISLIVTILEVLHGFTSTDKDKLKLMDTFGATKFQCLTKVVLPSSFPTIISSLKINVGLSWVGVIVGEFLVSKAGLGYLIVYGGQVFQMDLVMASILILAVAAILMYQGVLLFEKMILKDTFRKE